MADPVARPCRRLQGAEPGFAAWPAIEHWSHRIQHRPTEAAGVLPAALAGNGPEYRSRGVRLYLCPSVRAPESRRSAARRDEARDTTGTPGHRWRRGECPGGRATRHGLSSQSPSAISRWLLVAVAYALQFRIRPMIEPPSKHYPAPVDQNSTLSTVSIRDMARLLLKPEPLFGTWGRSTGGGYRRNDQPVASYWFSSVRRPHMIAPSCTRGLALIAPCSADAISVSIGWPERGRGSRIMGEEHSGNPGPV